MYVQYIRMYVYVCTVQLKGNVALVCLTLARVYLNLLFTILSYKAAAQKSLHTRFRMKVFIILQKIQHYKALYHTSNSLSPPLSFVKIRACIVLSFVKITIPYCLFKKASHAEQVVFSYRIISQLLETCGRFFNLV